MKKQAPHIPWIDDADPLPGPETAQKKGTELAGLVAAGGGLSVDRLLEAYAQGMFPWFNKEQPVLWWSPDPRMVLKTDEFRLHRSLRKTLAAFIANPCCEIKIDFDFEQIIQQCAQTARKGQPGTWIVDEMIEAYKLLYAAGFAHSVETWVDGQQVGGLYCICIGGAIFGESMFSHQTDASKIALSALVAFCRANQLPWIDCQQNTRHLASLGAKEISREIFLQYIRDYVTQATPKWEFDSTYWSNVLLSTNAL
jgi:leucyl/phenylalanyl-tRNA---protein transferase